MSKEVGVYVGGETICLNCMTEEEKGKATEDASPRDFWIMDNEYFGGLDMTISHDCDRCGKELATWMQC